MQYSDEVVRVASRKWEKYTILKVCQILMIFLICKSDNGMIAILENFNKQGFFDWLRQLRGLVQSTRSDSQKKSHYSLVT
jgi:hypothetical protein